MADSDKTGPEEATVYAPRTSLTGATPPPEREEPDETVFAPSSRPGTSMPGPAAPAARQSEGRVEIGMILNGLYRVQRLIGRGGMGEVFEGVNVHESDDRVAIKVILPQLASDPTVREMFSKEARALRALSHPALVQYRVVAQEPALGVFYIVTEFIDGPSLSDLVGKTPAPPSELRTLLRRLAEGLRAAHEVGAVHRDMSPDNVLLPGGRLGSAKVIDFGIAKDLGAGSRTIIGDGFAGKLGYVAPEQLGDFGREIGPWTDVYSLGLVLLSVSRGRHIDMGATLVDAVDRRRAGVDVSDAPEELRPVLQAMLEADPAKRLRSMDAVLSALDQGGAVSARQSPAPAPAKTPSKPRATGGPPRALLIGGGAAALVVVIAIIGLVVLTKPKSAPENKPTAAAAVTASGAPAMRARRAVEAALTGVPCSWLRLASVSDTPNGVAVKLSGVAGSTIDAQGAISRVVSAAGSRAADLDLADVGQITQAFCSTIDAFSPFRVDTVEGSERLTTNQQVYTMTRGQDGKLTAKAIIQIRIGDPSQSAVLVGIDQNGKVGTIFANRAAFQQAVAAKQLEQRPDDSFTLPLETLDPGWSGIMLLTGQGQLDTSLIDAPASGRDQAWQGRIRQALQAGGWKAEMVWYRAVAPTA